MGGHFPRRLFIKRGVFYFERRIPKVLQARYGRQRVRLCLHTSNEAEARKTANIISMQLEIAWNQARLEAMGLLTISALAPLGEATNASASQPSTVKLSDAHEIYVRLRGKGKGKIFLGSAERHFAYAIESLGDAKIEDLHRVDAAKFRDHLIDKGLSSLSIRRTMATVRAGVNLAISEQGVKCQNPFTRIFIPNVGEKKLRPPVPLECIRKIQRECLKIDDNRRHLIALISDTGMRLAEGVGLVRGDLHIDDPIPFVDVRPHPWRRLKTETSARQIPLVGSSLWAARQLLNSADGAFLFPDYAGQSGCNANSASAALNKFLKPRMPQGCVVHSFRHSLRDRLRAVECDPTIIDEIGGWSRQTVGNGYGSGYPLEVKAKWLAKIA